MTVRNIVAACGLCGLLLAGGCDASPKVAVVDMQQVVLESGPGRKAQDYINQLQKVYQQDLDIIQQKVAAYPDKEQALQIVQNALRTYQNELENRKSQVAQIVSGQIRKVITSYQQKHKFALVVNKENVLEYDRNADITPAVITAFDSVQIQLPALPNVVRTPQLPAPKVVETIQPTPLTPEKAKPARQNPAQRRKAAPAKQGKR